MSKKIPLELIEKELSESDLDGLTRMSVDIELKIQEEIEPMLAGLLSYFRCDGCGECCRNAPAVMTDDELVAIARRTGNEAFDALDGDILVNAFRSPCHFLTDRGCRIYDIKPRVCRLYPLSLKNIGFITLYLCPMGKKIQTELENFIKSKGVKNVRYDHDKTMQDVEDTFNEMRESVGFRKDEPSHVQIGLRYGYIPLFLKYLRHRT